MPSECRNCGEPIVCHQTRTRVGENRTSVQNEWFHVTDKTTTVGFFSDKPAALLRKECSPGPREVAEPALPELPIRQPLQAQEEDDDA